MDKFVDWLKQQSTWKALAVLAGVIGITVAPDRIGEIATAVGVHSGFSGCLTLEITNLGEVPIAIYPGMTICQLFLHKVQTSEQTSDSTTFFGKSKPVLGRILLDDTARKLAGFNKSIVR